MLEISSWAESNAELVQLLDIQPQEGSSVEPAVVSSLEPPAEASKGPGYSDDQLNKHQARPPSARSSMSPAASLPVVSRPKLNPLEQEKPASTNSQHLKRGSSHEEEGGGKVPKLDIAKMFEESDSDSDSDSEIQVKTVNVPALKFKLSQEPKLKSGLKPDQRVPPLRINLGALPRPSQPPAARLVKGERIGVAPTHRGSRTGDLATGLVEKERLGTKESSRKDKSTDQHSISDKEKSASDEFSTSKDDISVADESSDEPSISRAEKTIEEDESITRDELENCYLCKDCNPIKLLRKPSSTVC